MAEGSKARLVRCPKCENLLQEPPDYAVYKCGGCGAVLKAKKKACGSDGFSEKSDEERVRGGSETLECLSEKEGGSLGSASETQRGSDGIEVIRRKERIFVEKTGNSLSKADYKEVLIDSDRNGREEIKDLRLEQSGVEKEIRFVDRYRRFSERPVDNLSTGGNLVHIKSAAESLRLGASMDWWRLEGDGFGGTYGNSGAVAEHGGYPTFAYPDEGPSNYKPDSFYGYGERKMNRDGLDVPHRVENLEHNRAELLRKLDELKDQLSRSCDLEDKPRVPVDRTSPDPYGGQDIYNVSMQPTALDKHLPRPPYINHGTIPFTNHHNMDKLNFYPPPRHVVNENSAYEDPYQPQMMRRPPHQPPSQYPQRPPNEYFLGQYMEFNQDPFASYPHETFLHQPTCSCLHCYDQNWQVPPRVAPTVFSNRRIQKDPSLYHHVNLGQQSYNPQAPNPPQLYSRDPLVHTRWPSDIDSDIDGFGQSHSRRVVVAHGNGRLCYPIGGGAPFIACYNCFELLKLPSKLLMLEKNKRKLRCGACSTIIMFEIKNKKLIISVPTEPNQISVEDDEGSCELLNESLLSSNVFLNAHDNNPCSDDFDNPGYNFKSTEDNRLDLGKSEKRQVLTSSSSISSEEEEEESLDSVIVQGDVSNSAAQPSRDDLSPRLRGSPLQDHSDCPPNHAVSKNGQGNNCKRMDQDKVVLNRVTSRQNSVNDASMATELEVSFNDYLNTSLSQDSVEVSKEENQPKVDKGTDSFLMGLIKKSFRDFSRSTQSVENERPNVLINGQPIPDRMVKKAEKLAGPIQPGNYWYDFQGGFWGVMGQPCLGIIPPFIEEFNYPMPTNCGAGNTGVFVNGRELHQKDLDLLSCRGLPTTRDKFYILEISGRVVDEDSGKELDSLGKLAPTVEKVKRGFGVKTPRKVM